MDLKHSCVSILAVVLMAGPLVSMAKDVSREEIQEQAKSLAAKAGLAAKDAGAYREMALHAVENALASRDDAEEALLRALRTGKERLIDLAKDRLKDIVEESDRAVEQAEKVIAYAGDAEAAAHAATIEYGRVAKAETDRDAGKAARKVERLEEVARKASQKAFDSVEVLRERWLIRQPTATTSTTTTTTTQPPSPTPVGKR